MERGDRILSTWYFISKWIYFFFRFHFVELILIVIDLINRKILLELFLRIFIYFVWCFWQIDHTLTLIVDQMLL